MTVAGPADRSLRRELVTRRSLGLLLLALVVAGGFAALGHWQLSRAIEAGTVLVRPTETVLPLMRVATPGAAQTSASVGQSVRVRGRFVPADVLIAGDRLNDGRRGWWVVGHAVVDDPADAQLAVGMGWAPDRASAERAAAALRAQPASDVLLEGRYVDSDAAQPTTAGSPDALNGVSSARLVNLWSTADTGPVYEGLLVLRTPPAGLDAIYSPRPGEEVQLNLLNLLYAAEWALFAVAALYVWYRLVRDRWEAARLPAEDDAAPAEPALRT